MPRHFYLRLPHNNYPVACVAVQTQPTLSGEIGVDVSFAVATYNPADISLIPFNKAKARNMATGRLNSTKHRVTFTVPADRPEREIGRLICESIVYKEWREKHPHAHAAHVAAHHWLEQLNLRHPCIAPPEDHAIDTWHNEGGPQVFTVETQEQLEQLRDSLTGGTEPTTEYEPEFAPEDMHILNSSCMHGIDSANCQICSPTPLSLEGWQPSQLPVPPEPECQEGYEDDVYASSPDPLNPDDQWCGVADEMERAKWDRIFGGHNE